MRQPSWPRYREEEEYASSLYCTSVGSGLGPLNFENGGTGKVSILWNDFSGVKQWPPNLDVLGVDETPPFRPCYRYHPSGQLSRCCREGGHHTQRHAVADINEDSAESGYIEDSAIEAYLPRPISYPIRVGLRPQANHPRS